MPLILACDVGGTKTDVAVFSSDLGPRTPLAKEEFPSDDYPGLGPILTEFLGGLDLTVERACIDVAGPVLGGRAAVTNLPWTVDAALIRQHLGLEEVELLNDLEASAFAVPLLQPDELHILKPGDAEPHGSIAVIAPGTGLGEAFGVWTQSGYKACASEGGHADFAPADEVQIRLLQYLKQRYDHVSFERVCSGIGIPSLYEFLRETGEVPETEEVRTRLDAADDETPVIIGAAIDASRPDSLCAATLDLFASILGSEAGNLALKVLATGGVYLAGGIPLHALPAMEKSRFVEAFQSKGRLRDLLARVPVYVITVRAALLGAAARGIDCALNPDPAAGRTSP